MLLLIHIKGSLNRNLLPRLRIVVRIDIAVAQLKLQALGTACGGIPPDAVEVNLPHISYKRQ
jgi:hypothetical protein